MANDEERRRVFEARMAELKRKMEAGLLSRAQTLRQASQRLLEGDDSARRVLKQEGHKLRGIAGSYGYQELTDIAGELEQRASLSPPPLLGELVDKLATAAEAVGQKGSSAQDVSNASTLGADAATTAPTTPAMVPPAARPKRASLRPSVQGKDGGPLRVLAMDDDPTTLRLLTLTLRDIGGFDAVIVTSAREALEQLQTREFDIVISDAMMPDMNGREFCAAARAQGGACAQVPIVILSAATQDELGWNDGLTGPVEWLRKPFMPSSLVKDVARVAKARR
jgi:CheY-like chemotaxis protein